MAPAPAPAIPMTSLDQAIAKPPAGVVIPPKEIRDILEKTAGYIVRNGPSFEDRMRDRQAGNSQFSFLQEGDAYNPFYRWRMEEIRNGRGTDVSAGRVGETVKVQQQKPKGPEPPPEFEFSARMPNINAQDLEVVRLTAQYVAKNGRSFMTALSQRETGNYQFDFLRPQHSLYQFFQRLVEQYKILLEGNRLEAHLAQLKLNVKNKYHVLDDAKKRAEWVKHQEAQKVKKEEEEETEKIAFAQIDWHDFSVVSTIEFGEADDHVELPPPTSLNDLQTASLEQKAMMSSAPHHMRIEEAMPDVGDTYYPPAQQHAMPMPPPAYPQQQYTPTISPQPPMGQAYGMSPPPPIGAVQPSGYGQDDEEERAIRARQAERERAAAAQAAARGTGPVKIRDNNIPAAQQKRNARVHMALCPNCKQQIPMNELEQHMKIELLDPRWKEQKSRAEARYATTNLSTADVANNLKRLASQRTDVFDGVTGAPISAEEEARRKRQAVPAVGYDGSQGSKEAMQSLNIEDQIRRIHERARQ